MNIIFKTFMKIILIVSIIFILISIFTFTIAQKTNYEFANWHLGQTFYNIIIPGFMFSILLTLCGTIKKHKSLKQNLATIGITIIGLIIGFFICTVISFSVGFISIANNNILFKNIKTPCITIVKQSIGQGAFGEDGHRIVKLEPFLKYWNKVELIDTSKINKTEWIFVNKKIED
jgi:cytochrome c biogenesis factor